MTFVAQNIARNSLARPLLQSRRRLKSFFLRAAKLSEFFHAVRRLMFIQVDFGAVIKRAILNLLFCAVQNEMREKHCPPCRGASIVMIVPI